jgi:hypothetical protein
VHAVGLDEQIRTANIPGENDSGEAIVFDARRSSRLGKDCTVGHSEILREASFT